jgi:hypothetical protein
VTIMVGLGGLSSVMAGAGAVLMSASPHRPAQPVAAIAGGLDEQRGEQVLEFAAGQPDQPMR